MNGRCILLDTNVLLDYTGLGSSEDDYQNACQLIRMLIEEEVPMVVTPTILKDFEYLLKVRLKSKMRQDGTELSKEDSTVIASFANAWFEAVKDFCFVASVGEADVEIARILLKTHRDFEDNLITAVSKRIGASYVVTRDEALRKHSTERCISPRTLIGLLEDGIAF